MEDLIPLIFEFVPNRALLYLNDVVRNIIKEYLGNRYFYDLLTVVMEDKPPYDECDYFEFVLNHKSVIAHIKFLYLQYLFEIKIECELNDLDLNNLPEKIYDLDVYDEVDLEDVEIKMLTIYDNVEKIKFKNVEQVFIRCRGNIDYSKTFITNITVFKKCTVKLPSTITTICGGDCTFIFDNVEFDNVRTYIGYETNKFKSLTCVHVNDSIDYDGDLEELSYDRTDLDSLLKYPNLEELRIYNNVLNGKEETLTKLPKLRKLQLKYPLKNNVHLPNLTNFVCKSTDETIVPTSDQQLSVKTGDKLNDKKLYSCGFYPYAFAIYS